MRARKSVWPEGRFLTGLMLNDRCDKAPLRVAVCTVGELFGGVERHILGLAAELRAQGIEILLVLFVDGELAAQARAAGIDPIILRGANRFIWTTSRELANILKRHRIQAVHVHGYKATVFCSLARVAYPFALVKTEHGLPEPMAGRALSMLRDRFYRLLEAKAARIAGATVCYVTADLRRAYLRAHSGLPTTVIPNGVPSVDRDQFERPRELRRDNFNLTIVGRLDTVKGHHVAIQAMATEALGQEVHLHVLGMGPLEQRLRDLVAAHGLVDRVHFMGFRRDAYAYIAHSDVLLMPSLHEGLPYSLLEAMALGTPVVASSVGGLAETIEHDATGLLVPAGDAFGLATAIRRLQRDPQLRTQIGERAQIIQRTRYSLGAMTGAYLRIYQALTRSVAH